MQQILQPQQEAFDYFKTLEWSKKKDLLSATISITDINASIHNHDFEICGFAQQQPNGMFSFEMVNKGNSKEGRTPAQCTTLVNYPVVWHTHPAVSKIYPSLVDVLKVIKYSSTHTSFIFTQFGFWRLHCPGGYAQLIIGVPQGTHENRLNVTNTDPLTLKIKGFLDEFYRKTGGGRTVTQEAVEYLTTSLNTEINGFGVRDFQIQWQPLDTEANYFL